MYKYDGKSNLCCVYVLQTHHIMKCELLLTLRYKCESWSCAQKHIKNHEIIWCVKLNTK